MLETIEFRLVESSAHILFGTHEGRVLSSLTRKIELSSTDPRLAEMGRIQEELLTRGGGMLFGGWIIHRAYLPEELARAQLLRLIPTCYFEPMGEQCGTVYDESTACPLCGAGRRQVSDLEFNTTKIPKRADIATSYASEWVFSRRLADLLEREGISGVQLRPVRHHRRRESPICPDWVQPVVTSPRVQVVSPTHFAIDPVREDVAGKYRCPQGHVAGLAIVSEAYVDGSSWDRADLVQSEQLYGLREGLLVPQPLVLISQRFYQLLKSENIRGFRIEVAHLV